MKTSTPVKLNTYQTLGRNLRINFDEQYVESSEGQDAYYTYTTACVDNWQAVIKSLKLSCKPDTPPLVVSLQPFKMVVRMLSNTKHYAL